MKLDYLVEYVYLNLRERKLRSWLTILGIVIGVASVITLISLANGVNEQISSRLNTLQNNVIQISPGGQQSFRAGGGFGFAVPGVGGGGAGARPGEFGGNFRRETQELTFSQARDLQSVLGVDKVDPRIQGRVTISYRSKNTSVTLIGVDPDAFTAISNTPLVGGRALNSNSPYGALIGYRIYSQMFQGEDLLNRQMTLTFSQEGALNQEYAIRVIGLLNQSSGSFSTSDSAIYLPVTTAKAILNQSNPSQFYVSVKSGYDTDVVAQYVTDALAQLHNVPADSPDFTITTAATVQATVNSITDTLTLFLAAIAGISLLVGGIGVANTMFMSVLERTKEIGILKALGLRDSELLKLFLLESASIGIIGGVVGVLLSFAFSFMLAAASIPTLITFDLVALGVIFSGMIGILSGMIPARNASRLEPVEAIRYE